MAWLESHYVPLNNLDELAAPMPPDLSAELLDEPLHVQPFDEPLDEDDLIYGQSIDERFANLSAEEADELTRQVFWQNVASYRDDLRKNYKKPAIGSYSEQELVIAVLPYVASFVAGGMARPTTRLEQMDRIQNGNLSVLKAMHKFDGRTARALTAFIKPNLENHINKAEEGGWVNEGIYHGEMIRVKANSTYYQIRNFLEKLSILEGHPVMVDELRGTSNVSEEEIEIYQKFAWEHLPLHEVFNPNDDESAEPEHVWQEIEEATLSASGVERVLNLRILNARERELLVARAGLDGDPLTLKQFAEKLGVSEQRAHQLEGKLRDKLASIPALGKIIRQGTTL